MLDEGIGKEKVEPLRKRTQGGKPYKRRLAVEQELQRLETLTLRDIVVHARTQNGGSSISSEALVHILRRAVRDARLDGKTQGPIDALVSMLIARCEGILKRRLLGYDELAQEEIIGEVTNCLVDDICENGDKADYAEINFNHWLARNRSDAVRKYKRKAARTTSLGESVENLEEVEAQIVVDDAATEEGDLSTPEALFSSKQSCERANLPSIMEHTQFSADDLDRIAELVRAAKLPEDVLYAFLAHHYLGMKVKSEDHGEHTLVKHFGNNEKTIRNWIKRAEKVFSELRKATHECKGNDERERGTGAAGIPP
jgi:hypothetical protein